MNEEPKLNEIDLKTNKLKNCNWNQQGLQCRDNGVASFLEFKYKNGRLLLNEIETFSNPQDPEAIYINSEIDFNFNVSLYEDKLFENFQLRGWKNHIRFQVESLEEASHKSQLFEISYGNYAIITKVEDAYKLSVVKNHSQIKFNLPEKIKNFRKFINFPNASLFAILHGDETYKLIVADSNFNKNKRLFD